jgi:hypothetical protein
MYFDGTLGSPNALQTFVPQLNADPGVALTDHAGELDHSVIAGATATTTTKQRRTKPVSPIPQRLASSVFADCTVATSYPKAPLDQPTTWSRVPDTYNRRGANSPPLRLLVATASPHRHDRKGSGSLNLHAMNELPEVVSTFQDAHDRHDTDAALAMFGDDARVTDDGHDYRGRDEIRDWLSRASVEFTYTRTLLDATASAPNTWLGTNHLEGNFPGGVVDLRYRFVIDDGLIRALDIAP